MRHSCAKRIALSAACLVAGACAGLGAVSANESVMKAVADPRNWAIPTGNYANHRYSELKQITRDNVKDLKVAWTFSTGVLRGHEGAPLVVDGVMYVHTPFPNNVYALDLRKDGEILWSRQPEQAKDIVSVMCCDTVNRGVAYADGKIFLHQADTAVVALDAKTGAEVWRAVNGDPTKGEVNTASVMPAGDKLIVGISGGEFGVRGHITAYDIKTGKRVWRGYSVGPDADMLVDPEKTTSLGKPVGPDSSLKTWQGDQWKIGGGTTWGWYSYDPKLNLIYYGSGNPSTWNPKQRPGDNKWSATIWARDLDTGMARWVYQMTPHDEWDFDGANEMILADFKIDGKDVPALVHFDKNGFAYTLNRATGELLAAEKFDPAVNWAEKVDMDKESPTYGRPKVVDKYSTHKNGEDINTLDICPANIGAKSQQPAAFNPTNGIFYAPTSHVCMDYEPYRVKYTAGQPYDGGMVALFPGPGGAASHMGAFIAWDPATGKIKWSKPEQFVVWSGPVVTAGGVIFYGVLEGYVKALDLDGNELFKFKTPSAIVGNLFTYELDGKQYVGVLSGVGGWAGIGGAVRRNHDGYSDLGAVSPYSRSLRNYTTLGGVLTVFSLP
jgi:lanthanide-dependent methanol dehydrogenase